MRVNLGWWLSSFLPVLIILCAVFACLILVARRAEWDESWFWLGLLGAVSISALVCFFFAQRKFFTSEDGLVRLDVVLRLHNRLVAAAHGVGKWPGERQAVRDGWGWNWRRIGGALSLSAALLLLAGWVPIRRDAGEARRSPEEPLAWTQVENWLAALKAEKIADQEAVENFKEQLEELRKQPEEKWYSHGSLEAGDSLRQKTEDSIKSLERYQEQVENALSMAQEMGDKMPASELEKLDAQFKEGLQGLEMGALPLNKDMMKQLKGVDLKNMKQMSAAQMAQLQKKLQEGKLACNKSLGKTGSWDKNMREGMLATIPQGNGGVDRGPGTVPLVLKDEKSEVGSTKVETVSNDDMSRAALGDPLAVTQGEHKVDKSLDKGPLEGGAVASTGEGGEAVWKDSLTPQERKVLQRYFK